MKHVEMITCEYEGCNLPINKPHDMKYCIFHAPKGNKGVSFEEFNNKIYQEKIDKDDFNFVGYIFPGKIIFPNKRELVGSDFEKAQFWGSADFRNARFSGDANFSETQFMGNTYFIETKFSGIVIFATTLFSGKIYFREVEFLDYTDFSSAQFSRKVNFEASQFALDSFFTDTQFIEGAQFGNVQFSGNALFNKTHFLGDTNFDRTQFLENVDFDGAQFMSNANFSLVQFSREAKFMNNVISMNLFFNQISFKTTSYFYFRYPRINLSEENDKFIYFTNTIFLPFRAFFENLILKGSLLSLLENYSDTYFIFRHCQLRDVYFSRNDMSFFSFFKSNFDQSWFISCNWREEKDTVLRFLYKRKNIVFEDYLFRNIPRNNNEETDFRNKYQIQDLKLIEIESLYRRMKTALDRTKDYEESGWFYFNEFETKRKGLHNGPKKLIYYLYKIFSGYGEKPFWSFIWFFVFAINFSFIHLLSGLNTSKGQINYDLSLSREAIRNIISEEFWVDWFSALVFTIYRLIPINYMPNTDGTTTPVGLDGLLFALLNTFILILLLTFIGIGLKRQFRRF